MDTRDTRRVMTGTTAETVESGKPRLLLVVTWKEEGEWYLLQKMRERFPRVDVLQPLPGKKARPRLMAAIFHRLQPITLALRAFAFRKHYDVAISWSTPVGVCYGVLRRLLGGQRPPRHILRDFHISLTRTDWRYRFRLALLRFALPGIDLVLCTSRQEEGIYAEMFGISPDRLFFFPDSPPSQFLKKTETARPVSDYLFACGNSDRDFSTLIEAVREPACKTIILSQRFRPENPLPAHVQLIRDRVSSEELRDLIGGARAVAVPLAHYNVAAGQNSMLEAMAIGRPVIASDNLATREYADNGLTALLYPPGDALRFRALIRQVFADREMAEGMAVKGRALAESLLDKQVSMLTDLVSRLSSRP